jgi:hypothetical protein
MSNDEAKARLDEAKKVYLFGQKDRARALVRQVYEARAELNRDNRQEAERLTNAWR